MWKRLQPAGDTSSEVALTMDLLPTFAKLAGATIPPGHKFDGVDVMPVLKGEGKIPERVLHWKFGEAWAVRQGSWKLIGKETVAQTLVDLQTDLGEKQNRITQKPELAGQLMTLHRQWIGEVGEK